MEDYSKYLRLINNCDQDSPLLSTTPLGKRLSQIPLDYVPHETLMNLTQALNIKQLIPTETGLARDYRGLAEVIGFSQVNLESIIRNSSNPTLSLIKAHRVDKLKNNPRNGITVNDLLKIIEKIERFDVIDDTLSTFIDLACLNDQQLVQFSSRTIHSATAAESHYSSNDFNQVLTLNDDTEHFSGHYDVYICFTPQDGRYAQHLSTLLRNHGLNVVTANDLLPGQFEQDALTQVILRCRKVIIILTPNFTNSEECKFQTKFANEIGIKDGNPKIIPVLFEACDDSTLPSMIKVLSKIDFTNPALGDWQMLKLLRSLNPSIHYRNQGNSSKQSDLCDLKVTGQRTLPQPREIPAITMLDPQSGPISINSTEPLIELPHSETLNSAGIVDVTEQNSRNIPTTTPANPNNLMGWLNKTTKRVFRNGSHPSPSMESLSSRAHLISTNSSSNNLSEDTFKNSD